MTRPTVDQVKAEMEDLTVRRSFEQWIEFHDVLSAGVLDLLRGEEDALDWTAEARGLSGLAQIASMKARETDYRRWGSLFCRWSQ